MTGGDIATISRSALTVELPYKSMYGDLFIMTRITVNGKPLGSALAAQDAPRYVTVRRASFRMA